jgi:hypothetical protein
MPRREVTLPVCELCGQVGPLPVSVARKDHCNGGLKNRHKQIRMVPVKFKKVCAEAGAKV